MDTGIKKAYCPRCRKQHLWNWCYDCYTVINTFGDEEFLNEEEIFRCPGIDDSITIINITRCTCGEITSVQVDDYSGYRASGTCEWDGDGWEEECNSSKLC